MEEIKARNPIQHVQMFIAKIVARRIVKGMARLIEEGLQAERLRQARNN